MSAPVNGSQPFVLAGPPENTSKHPPLLKQQTAPKTCTNPFLNGELKKQNKFSLENEKSTSKNPFLEEEEEQVFSFEPSTIKSLMDFDEPVEEVKEEAEELVTSTSTVNRKVLTNGSASTNGNHVEKPKRQRKYSESETSDSVTRQLRKMRQRSRSETEAADLSSVIETAAKEDWYVATQTFTEATKAADLTNGDGPEAADAIALYAEQLGKLHKTVSETYINTMQYNRSSATASAGPAAGVKPTYNNSHSKILVRQGSFCRSYSNSCSSSVLENGINSAVSCESLNSESSVCVNDLEQPQPSITGHLCIGLQYDK
jgi:chemotaxis protein histidine kinase CheA